MKRLISIFGVILLLLISTSTSSFAYSFGIEDFDGTYVYGKTSPSSSVDPLQGIYLGTVYDVATDNASILLDFLNNFAGMSAVTSVGLYGKSDEATLFTPALELNGDSEPISGTWQTYPGSMPADPDVIDLIIVKGGTSFSVHQYVPSASAGEWNVGYLDEVGKKGVNVPALSHVSAYVEGTPVPEPATILLISAGLIGIVGVSRRKRLKKI